MAKANSSLKRLTLKLKNKVCHVSLAITDWVFSHLFCVTLNIGLPSTQELRAEMSPPWNVESLA